MTHKFLVAPRLNQALETAPYGGGYPSNEITRRTFLKRSGGATVASLVAWNLASQQAARAETGEGSGSGSDSAPPSKPGLRTSTRTMLISGTDADGNYTFSISGNNDNGYVKAVQMIVTHKWTYQ